MLSRTTELRAPNTRRPRHKEENVMPQIAIRRAEMRDVAAVHAILTSEHVIEGSMRIPHAPLSTTEERLREQPDRIQLVAEINGDVVGFAEVLTQFDNPRASHAATLNMIATRQDKQSNGVCSALIETVIRQCRDHWGLRRLGLVVWSDNSTAIRLYEKHGFQHEGQFKDYVRAGTRFKDALAMARLFTEC